MKKLSNEKEISLAYRCPICGEGVESVKGFLTLSGDLIKLKCPCGQSDVTIEFLGNDKIQITVPCIICPSPHVYVLDKNVLDANDLFELKCSYTGINIGFIGLSKDVGEALKEQAEQLAGFLEETGVDNLDLLHTGEKARDFDDPAIEETIRFVISDLVEENKLHCGCKAGDTARYGYEFVAPDYEDVKIFCASCGYEKIFPMQGTENANSFLQIDQITLEDPDIE